MQHKASEWKSWEQYKYKELRNRKKKQRGKEIEMLDNTIEKSGEKKQKRQKRIDNV